MLHGRIASLSQLSVKGDGEPLPVPCVTHSWPDWQLVHTWDGMSKQFGTNWTQKGSLFFLQWLTRRKACENSILLFYIFAESVTSLTCSSPLKSPRFPSSTTLAPKSCENTLCLSAEGKWQMENIRTPFLWHLHRLSAPRLLSPSNTF